MKQLNHSPEAAAHLLGLTLRETEERFARIGRQRQITRGLPMGSTAVIQIPKPVVRSPL